MLRAPRAHENRPIGAAEEPEAARAIKEIGK
jgi:hypothetical protein